MSAPGFDAAFATYYEGCQRIHRATLLPDQQSPAWRITRGKRFVKVIHNGGAHSFVELATGGVFKAASWSTPAKHARGNIFDAWNGLRNMGPFGPAYLR